MRNTSIQTHNIEKVTLGKRTFNNEVYYILQFDNISIFLDPPQLNEIITFFTVKATEITEASVMSNIHAPLTVEKPEETACPF